MRVRQSSSKHRTAAPPPRSTGTARLWFVIPCLALPSLFPVGCIPFPTTPQETVGSFPSSGRGRDPGPAPRFDDLDRARPSSSDGSVSFEPITFDPMNDGTPSTAESDWDGIPEATMPRPSLEDRLTIQRRGADGRLERPASTDARTNPTIDIRPRRPLDEPSDEVPIDVRRSRLLVELETYAGRAESRLGDGERLAKHRLQMRLMALHFIEPIDPAGLEILIESMSSPHEPGRSHSLLRASFYESIDLERKSAEVLAELAREFQDRIDPTFAFRIDPPIICSRIEGLGRYRALGNNEFRPGAELRLYVEVFGIENKELAEQFRQRLSIEFVFKDRDGQERGRQTSRTEGPPTDEPVVDSFLNLRYSIPREIPFGAATLEIAVRDLSSGAVSRQTVDLEIEP